MNQQCDACGQEITEANRSLIKASMCKSCFESGLNHEERRQIRLEERRLLKKAARRRP